MVVICALCDAPSIMALSKTSTLYALLLLLILFLLKSLISRPTVSQNGQALQSLRKI